MKYRVAFKKRTRADGEQSEADPTLLLDGEMAEGVVAEKQMVEWLESAAQHSQDVLDEDDAFLGMASTEVWEYDIVAGRETEFEDAMRNSEVVFEYTVIDEEPTPPAEAGSVPLAEQAPIAPNTGDVLESDLPTPRRAEDDSLEPRTRHFTDRSSTLRPR